MDLWDHAGRLGGGNRNGLRAKPVEGPGVFRGFEHSSALLIERDQRAFHTSEQKTSYFSLLDFNHGRAAGRTGFSLCALFS